jgi:hypothetical protein
VIDSAKRIFPLDTAQPTQPSQFYDLLFRQIEPTPERRLMAAILEDGLRCWIRNGSRHDEADRWIFGDSVWAPLTFETVCGALGIDPAWLRERLRRRPSTQKLSQVRITVRVTDAQRIGLKKRRVKKKEVVNA